jgi:hypothetical protein
MDPGTAMLIATAVATAAKGASDYFTGAKEKTAAKRRSKETKRETYANMLGESMDRNAELSAHGLKSSSKLGKSRSQSLQDTSDLVRRAFNI